MGTIMAPSYAIIFMHVFEKQFLETYHLTPPVWWRYIDDIFFLWPYTELELNNFISTLNNTHPTIKFTSEHSKERITFLDVSVSKDPDGSLHSDLYCKPTDMHQYLLPSSCHPPHICKNIPYSQALRLRRICSSDADFQYRCSELADHLRNRNYKNKIITNQIAKAADIPRAQTLVYKDKDKSNKRVPLVTTYHPQLPKLGSIVNKHMPTLHLSPKLRDAISEPPVIAYRRPKNLRDLLVSARLKPAATDTHHDTVCTPCNKPCKACNYVTNTNSFQSIITQHTFKILQNITCSTTHLIYLISCSRCGIQYVGETKNALRTRLYGHLSDIRTKKDKAVSNHFNSPNHSMEDLTITGIDASQKLSDHNSRLKKETFWISQLRCLAPLGLNIDE